VVEHPGMAGVAWLSDDSFLATSDENQTLIWDVRHPGSGARWVIPYGFPYLSLSPSGHLATDGQWIYAVPGLSRIYRLQAPEGSLRPEYGAVVWMGDDLVVAEKWPYMASYKLPWHPSRPPANPPRNDRQGSSLSRIMTHSLLLLLLFYVAAPVWFLVGRYRTSLGSGLARVLDNDPLFLGLLGFSRLLDALVTLLLVESRGELNLFTRFLMDKLGLEATLLILTPTPIILAVLVRRYISKGEARAREQGRDEDAAGLRRLARIFSMVLVVASFLPIIWNGLVT